MLRTWHFALVLTSFILFSSCLSGSRSPTISGTDTSIRERALRSKISALELAIEGEDSLMLSEIFSNVFTVDASIAPRFVAGSTGGDPSTFFITFFQNNENISFSLEVQSVEITGEVGVVECEFSLSSVYILDVPPTTNEARAEDILVFQVEGDEWKLVSWKEKSTA